MFLLNRLRFWGPVFICWALAAGALYVHPAFWAPFGIVLAVFLYVQVRQWGRE